LERWSIDAYQLDARTRHALKALLGGSLAPEGIVRYTAEPTVAVEAPSSTNDMQPGAVLDIEDSKLRIWTAYGSDDGAVSELPEQMPGWLATPGAVFDISGDDIATARYAFHRAAYRDEEELFGLRG
jgi:hypothetical protein